MDDHSSAALVAKAVKLPTRTSGLKCPCGGLRWRGLRPYRGPFHARFLFGIAPGGACHAVLVAKTAVGSYPTVSPSPWTHAAMPRTMAVSSLWRFPWGYPRRALPGTLTSWSPDFPRGLRPAARIGVMIVVASAEGVVVPSHLIGVDRAGAIHRRGERGNAMLCDCLSHRYLRPSANASSWKRLNTGCELPESMIVTSM